METYRAETEYPGLEITYPYDEAVFPPEMAAPTVCWKDAHTKVDLWLVTFEFSDGESRIASICRTTQWTPSAEQWEVIKARSVDTPVELTVLGVNRAAPSQILSAANVTISTSKDEVGAPIFYREVNLPFIDAVKDPSRIRWRFGEVSSQEPPPIVLEKLPVCGNCHSFSGNGSILGMDVDYANDRGSYAIVPLAEETTLGKDNIITWNDYRKEDGTPTYGLLSQVSPDGKYVISTVKDRSVFVPRPGLEFSQLFFPVQGILAVYCRETGKFFALPGANDPRYVQSNPTWSPDGKTIVFARSESYRLKDAGTKVLLTRRDCAEFLNGSRSFLFDLYRIPFNDGKGGQAEPLEGASNDGMSNYFPKYSPDGKWIVFCKAKSFMLLQPDSQLYVVPAEGGEARRMRCNIARMNSWHSWSPNGRWLVFSSKANGPYTQLWLTHIDEQGRSSPPVMLSHFTAADRAANIPEFVNIQPDAIRKIRQQFVDSHSFVRAAHEYHVAGDFDGAVRLLRQALQLDPQSAEAHNDLGDVLLSKGLPEEAKRHFLKAIQYDPECVFAHVNLGIVSYTQGEPKQAVDCFKKAIALYPELASAHDNWGNALSDLGEFDQAVEHYEKALEINPQFDSAHYNWGNVLMRQGNPEQAIDHYAKAVDINPRNSRAHGSWGNALADLGEFDQAIEHYRRALEIDPQSNLTHFNWGNALLKLNRPDEAIQQWEKAVALSPEHTQAHLRLGNAWAAKGAYEQALTHLQRALATDPHDLTAINDLAWLLATCPKDEIRDGTRAVKLTELACEVTQHKMPALLDTLAAAYAEAGRFPEAVSTATQAQHLAEQKHESLAERIGQRLELYKAGKPYRQRP